ncbi:hypothetical protein BX666DRAFT_1890627 [Dichotomocladium elegans]|nr:hypothetical protein BX666DRAFT_1890627 [Dichotomocladium elegans]
MSQPTPVFIAHRCFMSDDCQSNFRTSQNLRRHLAQAHEFDFPSRISKARLRNNDSYLYLSDSSTSSNLAVTIHFGCPICQHHCAELSAMRAHFEGSHHEHLPNQQREHDQSSSSSTLLGASVDVNQSISGSSTTGQKRQSDEAICFDGINLDQPLGEHLVINNLDVSAGFHNMKMSLKANKWKLSLEDNLLLILSSTSVLLLDGNKYPEEVKPYFDYDQWRMIDEYIQQAYGIKRQPIPLATATQFSSILDRFINKKIGRDEAEISFKSLALPTMEKKIAKAIGNLVSKLPLVTIEENVNETELCSRFIDPFLAGLFDDPDNSIYLRWLDETTFEAKYKEVSSSRPDLSVTKSLGVKWATTLAYGEAKSAMYSDDHFIICKDLIKVARVCKDALDNQLFEGILAVQIIGRTVVFYLLTLPAQSIYTMIPLATIKVPDSINELPGLVYKVPDILKVLDIFERVCVRAAHPETIKHRCAPTLPMANIQQLFSQSKNRKRSCHIQLYHN